jgi:hypothetical protein
MNEVTRATPAQGFGDALMRVLSDPNIPADKLQIVLQTQKDLLADRRREAFQTAFVAMAAEMPQVTKEGVVELTNKEGKRFGSYKYALWEDMDEAIRPVLHKHGFALTFAEKPTSNGHIQLRGELLHVDGYSIIAERNMPPDVGPGRNALQAQGSAISYAKRYLAEELCNIVRKGEDDDGKSATIKLITDAQAKELEKLMAEVKTTPEVFLRLFVTGCETMADIPARDFPRLVNALREKQRSMKEKGK